MGLLLMKFHFVVRKPHTVRGFEGTHWPARTSELRLLRERWDAMRLSRRKEMPVCTENLNADVVVMKSGKDRM